MKFVDDFGNAHIMGESEGVAVASRDDRCKWGVDRDGQVYISVDGSTVLSVRAWIKYSDRWIELPYKPINIRRILYRKTHAVKAWLGYRTRTRRDRRKAPPDRVIEEQETGWEVGFRIRSRLNDLNVNMQASFLISKEGYSEITISSASPIRVELVTAKGTELFTKDTGDFYEFKAGIL